MIGAMVLIAGSAFAYLLTATITCSEVDILDIQGLLDSCWAIGGIGK